MTILELFPWGLAILVAMISMRILAALGCPMGLAVGVGLLLGMLAWVMHFAGLHCLILWLERRRSMQTRKGASDESKPPRG
jgi:hypothetical protein